MGLGKKVVCALCTTTLLLSQFNFVKGIENNRDLKNIEVTLAYENLSKAEIEKKMERVAIKYAIPLVILKSIAYEESRMNQFIDGQPLVSYGSYGILQVTPGSYYDFDIERLKYDIDYNLECGAQIIKSKWNTSFNSGWSFSRVGNMDPRVLENWYFTLWAYNGWSSSNNPNTNYNAYQNRVIRNAKDLYGQDITPIAVSSLPASGLPDGSAVYATPENYHIDDFVGAKKGKIVIDKSSEYTGINTIVKSSKDGNKIGELNGKNPIEILEDGVPVNGVLMYKIKEIREDGKGLEGWAHLKKVIKSDFLPEKNTKPLTPKSTDFDKSGLTDIIDLKKILDYKEKFDKKNDTSELSKYDINYDNIIDDKDLEIVNKNSRVKLIDYKKADLSKLKVIDNPVEVDNNYKWEIELKDDVTEEGINKCFIQVIDNRGEEIKVKKIFSQEDKKLIIESTEEYDSAKNYFLIVYNLKYSKYGNNQDENLFIMKFRIK